jgi:hypothetical protein
MKKNTLFFCLLLTLSTSIASASDTFAPKPVASYNGNCSFNKVAVLDLRVNKANFGYIKVGALNIKTDLACANPTDMFSQFIGMATEASQSKASNTLLMVIRNFKMEDRPVNGEIGTFYARIEFYLGKDDLYAPVLKVDSFFETASGWDVTNGLLKMASTKMTQWVMDAAGSQLHAKTKRAYTQAAIEAEAKQGHPSFKIYTEGPKKGVYYTEEQFLNNEPVDIPFFGSKDGVDGAYKFFRKNDKGKNIGSLDDQEWFAVYDGKKIYKHTFLGNVEMYFSNNELYFPEAGHGILASDNVAIFAGMVGVLVSNAATAKKSSKNVVYSVRYNPETKSSQVVGRLR